MNAPDFTYPPLLESKAYLGDCLDVLRNFPEASIDFQAYWSNIINPVALGA